MRYFGARSFRHLCTSVAMLYCVHCRTNMHYRSPRRRSSGQSLMITTFSEQMEPLQYVMECVFCMSRTAIYATLITYLEMSFRVEQCRSSGPERCALSTICNNLPLQHCLCPCRAAVRLIVAIHQRRLARRHDWTARCRLE